MLVPDIARIRDKELFTMSALTSISSGHDMPSLKGDHNLIAVKNKRWFCEEKGGEEDEEKKKYKLSRLKNGRKQEEGRSRITCIFKSAGLIHFQIIGDICASNTDCFK